MQVFKLSLKNKLKQVSLVFAGFSIFMLISPPKDKMVGVLISIVFGVYFTYNSLIRRSYKILIDEDLDKLTIVNRELLSVETNVYPLKKCSAEMQRKHSTRGIFVNVMLVKLSGNLVFEAYSSPAGLDDNVLREITVIINRNSQQVF